MTQTESMARKYHSHIKRTNQWHNNEETQYYTNSHMATKTPMKPRNQKVSEYDKEIPQSHNADQPTSL